MDLKPTNSLDVIESVIELCSSLVNRAAFGHDYLDEFDSSDTPQVELLKGGMKPDDVFSLLETQMTLLETLFSSNLFKDLVEAALNDPGFKIEHPNLSDDDGRLELYKTLASLKGYGKTFVELYERLLPLYEELEDSTHELTSYIDASAILKDLRTAGELFELQALVVIQSLKGEWRKNEKCKKLINLLLI